MSVLLCILQDDCYFWYCVFFLLLYGISVTWLQYCVTCCSISVTMSMFRCCFRLLYFCSMGQRVRVPLSLRLYWLLVFYRHYSERTVVLSCRRTSILTDIRLLFLSFCIVRWCPLRTCALLLSLFSFIFLLLCWSFGTNWQARGRYCRCVGGSVGPWPSITVPNSVALCSGMTVLSALM